MTMTVIQHIELGSAAANITFSSIPNTYTDLVLVCSLRYSGSFGIANVTLRVNGSTATQYSERMLYTSSGSVTSASTSNIDRFDFSYAPGATNTASTFSSTQFYFPNYLSSNAKSMSAETSVESNGTPWFEGIVAGLWNNTTAISSLALIAQENSTFAQGSSATLYGVLKGSDGVTTVS